MSLKLGIGKKRVNLNLRNPFRQKRLEQRVGNLEYKVQSQEIQIQLFFDLIRKMGDKMNEGKKKHKIFVK